MEVNVLNAKILECCCLFAQIVQLDLRKLLMKITMQFNYNAQLTVKNAKTLKKTALSAKNQDNLDPLIYLVDVQRGTMMKKEQILIAKNALLYANHGTLLL